MNSKFILFAFLGSIMGSNAFCMDREYREDIFPPDVTNYQGKSRLGNWRLKKPGLYEQKGIPSGTTLYPYHAWIKHTDEFSPLHCIYYTDPIFDKEKDKERPIIVSFIWENPSKAPLNPRQYYFELTPEVGLIKEPYSDGKTNIIRGAKCDIWCGVKHWDPRPDNVLPHMFPVKFIYKNVERPLFKED